MKTTTVCLFVAILCIGPAGLAAEPSLRELELMMEKIKTMQVAAQLDIDRGGLLQQNGQLRLELLKIEEQAIKDKIKKTQVIGKKDKSQKSEGDK